LKKIKIIQVLSGVLFFLSFSCVHKKPATTSSSALPVAANDTPKELKVKALFIDGCREKLKGNLEIAENLFKECVKLDPASSAAHYELANIYRFSGLYDQALTHAKVAALAEPGNEWYNLLYIECLHNKRMYNEAVTRYESLLKLHPYRPDFFEGLASEYVYAGKYEKAIQTYDRMEQVVGVNENTSLRKIKLYKELKKWKDAEDEIKKLIKEDPKEARYFTYLAELYQDEGKPEKAFETYNEILKSEPNNPYVHLALADYYRQQRNEEAFFKEVRTAFISPDLDVDNKIKILISYYNITSEQKSKYLDQAFELCKLLVDSNPNEPKAHAMYADFLARDNKTKEAWMEFLKVIQFDKSRYEVWSQLLKCELDLSEYDSLAKHSSETMDLFPNQPVPYYYNGLAYMRLKKYQKAVAPLKEGKQFVYENTPLLVTFCTTLADVYNTIGEYEKSDKEFEEALQLSPDEGSILNNYAYYLSLRKENLDKAERLSRKSLDINPSNVAYLDTYGWILFQQGKYKEAKVYFEKAIDKGGFNRPAIVEHYGDLLYKLNEPDRALENWKKSKELGNTSETLLKKISDKKYYEP
jgi:tetratricopeptide (TPR) repeat protein